MLRNLHFMVNTLDSEMAILPAPITLASTHYSGQHPLLWPAPISTLQTNAVARDWNYKSWCIPSELQINAYFVISYDTNNNIYLRTRNSYLMLRRIFYILRMLPRVTSWIIIVSYLNTFLNYEFKFANCASVDDVSRRRFSRRRQ